MPDTFHTFIILGLGLAACSPIILAIQTLRGMRTKLLYPLLRIKRSGRSIEPLIVLLKQA
ncbi:hypothetical protein DNFV4_02478 [Nitrospira tepida]|uniref:Uncharacterized protein n=1 Tax=Nitrospira tepida TaxID=2973512 RepID=A0AA86MZP9_9BACT|nr:hypothetical protein [Nitrospira tepida]CAI4032053.1 hypothetical protein DNFV4_02478 [Nitrospira tepida]